MVDASSSDTHPLFERLMALRQQQPVRDDADDSPPSEFALYALNAILALSNHTTTLSMQQQQQQQQQQQHVPDAADTHTHSHAHTHTHPPRRRAGALPHAADKRFPVALLKCPRHVYVRFVTEHKLDAKLAAEIQAARLRKYNRKCQRISRSRQAVMTQKKHVGPEDSDDEGACSEIDMEAVHAQLMAGIHGAAGAHGV